MKPLETLTRSKEVMQPMSVATPGSESPEERGLIIEAQAGDQRAFRMLVERHRDRAYGLALRIVHSPADAEEVAQDAFVRAWLALPRFRGEASFATWLYRIVARRAIDRAAVLRRRGQREVNAEGAEEGILEDSKTDSSAAQALTRPIERLVAVLPESQRTVITLFYYEEHSVAQVAAILGMPEGTVKTHLSRARAALRAGLLKRKMASE